MGYCKGVSYGAVPMPDIRIYNPQQQSYSIQGNVSAFNSQTGYTNYTYSGTATPYSGGFASGMASGMMNGMALGAAFRANIDREEVFNACMMNLGWSEKIIPEKNTPKLPVTEIKNDKSKGEWGVLICRLFSDYETPGAFHEKYKSIFVFNEKNKIIEAQSKKPLVIRVWNDNQIVVSKPTDTKFNTSPPISEHIVEIINLNDSKYTLTAAWMTDSDIPLSDSDLKRIAGTHPMWQKKDGIISWTAHGSCKSTESD